MVTRTYLLRGDKADNGAVIVGGSANSTYDGIPTAREGDPVYCPVCKQTGVIVCVGPRWSSKDHGKEEALSGDICVCGCNPSPVFHASRPYVMVMTAEQAAAQGFGASLAPLAAATVGRVESAPYAMQKVAEENLVSNQTTDTERICPNMSNDEFGQMVMQRRDKAVALVDRRLADLRRWSSTDRARVMQWFGADDSATRDYLAGGLSRIRGVLLMLTPDNFVRYSEAAMSNVGCTSNSRAKLGVVAEVCAPDTTTHTIAIHLDFCTLRDFSYRTDSQVSTLIHEVSHFKDTFGTSDPVYFMSKCQTLAQTNPGVTLHNADSIAGYVIYEE